MCVCQPCDLALSLVKYKRLDLQTQKMSELPLLHGGMGRVSIGPTQSWLVSRMIIGDVKAIQGLMMLQKYFIPFQQGLFCLGELEKSRMPYNSPVEISLSCLLFSAVMYFSVILKMNGLYFPSFTMHHSVFPWSESLHVTS